MTSVELKKLLVQLRRLPDTSPAKALAELRRLIACQKEARLH
ncbi:hypothetical protein [Reyranella soli]|nr:hypothetical protein [Reyranella soli]